MPTAGINVAAFVDWLGKVGVVGAVIFFVVGLQQGWWFLGRERDDLKEALAAMQKDRDEWKFLAMSSMGAAERTVRVAATVLPAPATESTSATGPAQ